LLILDSASTIFEYAVAVIDRQFLYRYHCPQNNNNKRVLYMSSKIMKITLLTLFLSLQGCTTCDIANLFGNDICNIAAIEQVSERQSA